MPVETASEDSSEAARWRRIRRKVIQRAIAVIVGIVLWFLLAFLSPEFIVRSEWRWFAVHIVGYTFATFILAFIWPDGGWRLGPYLSAIWAVMLILIFVISDPPRVIHWKEELLTLLAILMVLPGACLGGWAGAALRRRFSSDVPGNNAEKLSTP